MTADKSGRLDEAVADIFCITAEVSAILDRHRPPRDLDDPEFWADTKRKAMADWHAGLVPIWWRNPDDTWVFLGYENDPEALRLRDEYAAAKQAEIEKADRAMNQAARQRRYR